MQRRRIAALATVPIAVLIGLATYSASAAGEPAPKTAPSTVSSPCNAPTSDKVLTVEEGIQLIRHCKSMKSADVAGWHWMGNYATVYDVANVANSGGIGPGQLIATPTPTGSLVPAFMYY